MDRRKFCQSAVYTGAALSLTPWRGYADIKPTTINAIKGSGDLASLEQAALSDLRDSLRGRLLLPDSKGYDKARQLRNRMLNKHPALIAQCAGAGDVRRAVNFARHYELLTAIKCGGHNVAGKGSCDGGIMIDLSPMQGVQVDPISKRARVAGGSLLAALDQEAQSFGLVTTSGTVSHTGVGGLALGGGFGRLARKYGLTIDNITGANIITADGRFHRVNKSENEDLFWGIRGGGGNFGVVTSFEFQLHAMTTQVIGGNIYYPYSKAKEILKFYADYSQNIPDDMYVDLVIFAPPAGIEKQVYLNVCYSGPHEKAEEALKPLHQITKPSRDEIKLVDYVALQSSSDDTDPRGTGQYLKSGFTTEISSGLIDALIEHLEPHPERGGMAFFQQAGGEIGRVAADATAFPHRYATHNMTIGAVWRSGTDADAHINWARQYWKEVDQFTSGFYTNDAYSVKKSRAQTNYLGNYDRLVSIKNTYDPENLFRVNTNILPSKRSA